MNIAALLTSKNEHYCTPPEVVRPMRRTLVPKGSGRRLMDPASNGASIVGANLHGDGITVNGLELRACGADAWFNNPPYGGQIAKWIEWQHYSGRVVGVPGISLLPARTDTAWCDQVFASADAWVFVRGRLTFWIPIPLARHRAAKVLDKDGNELEPYYLRRWYPTATDEDLPKPFRLLAPGLAVGPELGSNGKPQSAPFPSLIPFWADPHALEPDPRDELDALRELVRSAAQSVRHGEVALRGCGSTEESDQLAVWQARAEQMLGSSRYIDDLPLRVEILDRLTRSAPSHEYPIDVRTFARHFGPLGTLCVARGRYRGVHRMAAK
jgi:hypothetical protein